MLPSTGYFKGILCPFNENGLCERPYCHYRHIDFDESGAILQKLVSAAVLKALQQNDTSGAKTSTLLSQGDNAATASTSIVTSSSCKATYNPTPIAELNKINSTDTETLDDPNELRKRHIPVPYTPRKPAGLPIKRPADINDPKPFIYNPPGPPVKYKPGSAENVQNDKYTPAGHVESKEQYLPGIEKELPQYTPDNNTQDSPTKLNYVPTSDKSVNKKKVLEYRPAKVAAKTEKPLVTYQPTPRALAPYFSSDEDEPETKKRKLSSDLNGFDDLGPEFDILDQILDEEKPNDKTSNNKEKLSDKAKHSKDSKNINGDISHSEKNNKSQQKSKSDKDKSEKKSSGDTNISKVEGESHKTKSDKKSSDENHRKKIDDNHKSKSDKKSDKKSSDNSKPEKKSSDEKHNNKSEKTKESHKSKSDKKSTDDSHRSKSDKKDKEKDKGHKKSSHKSSNKDKEKIDGKEKQSSENKKHSSRSSDNSQKHSKHSSSKKSDKHSESRSSSSSKSKENKSKEKRHKKSKYKDRERSKDKVLNSSDNDAMDNDNGLEAEDYEISDADEDTIALECKRIFEEYVPTEKPKSPDENVRDNLTEDEYVPSKKRVSRTIDKNIKVIPKAPVKPDFKVSAANTMAERLSKVREFHSARSLQSSKNTNPAINSVKDHSLLESQKPAFHVPTPVPSKIRIAHVPYVSSMLNTKKTIAPSQVSGNTLASSSTTISQTVKKGVQRVAHMPSEKFIDRPGVLEPLASKIPANIRSIYLNMMIDECLKLYLSTHDAYARAQHEELSTSKKCSTVPIYKNSAVLAVSRLRKELAECNGVKKSASECSTLKPDSSLKAMNSGSWSIESKNRKVYDNSHEFTGAKFYKNIQKWVLTEEQLQQNSFPRPHESGQKGRAIIHGQNKKSPPKGYIRTCCRCNKEYSVDKKGFAVVKEECIYHPNRKYRVRGEARYQCCSQDGTSDGCCVAPSHVYEYVDFDNLKGYVKTLPPERKMDDYGVYSLDCEMCYTTNGLDLTRVTVINSACKVVYETLIKPLHPIVDYNTRYSGITEEQMSQVKTTLLEVQATLLAMFNSKTILVGHSLESDFKALKLIHDTVIDTSVLFPHKMGPPYKRALRNLSSEYLKKIIQNSVEGHDSAEDAMVCMELLQYKLKEDLKTR